MTQIEKTRKEKRVLRRCVITLVLLMVSMSIAPACLANPSPDGPDTTPKPKEAWDENGRVNTSNDGSSEEWIVVTPFDKKDKNGEAISKELSEAYEQIMNADSLKELVTRDNIVSKAEELAGHNISPENLIVRDLFNLTVSDGVTFPLTIKYELNLGEEEWVVLIHYIGKEKWEALDNERVVNNGDGTVTVTVDERGIYAFVTEKVPKENVKLDKGVSSLTVVICIVSALGIATVCIVIRHRKKRSGR